MKKTITFFLFILFQVSYAQDIYLSAKTGVNISTYTGANTTHFSEKTSFHAGIAAEFSFVDLFSIQAEGLFSNQGAQANLSVNANYIAIPVMVKLYPTELVSLDAGVQYAYLVNSNFEIGGIEIQETEFDQSDVALVGGFTIKTRIPLYFQARYVMGVTEIDKFNNWRNKVFQFSVGYRFL